MENKLIDPRLPRFSAGITSIFSLASFALLMYDFMLPAVLILSYIVAIFSWTVFLKNIPNPYSVIFNSFIKPRLDLPESLEDPRGPAFAQKLGLIMSFAALCSTLIAPWLAAIFAALLFIASALNAYLNVCLGCMLYLRLRRYGINL